MSEEKSVVINITAENASVTINTSAPEFGFCAKIEENEKDLNQSISTFSTQSPGRP